MKNLSNAAKEQLDAFHGDIMEAYEDARTSGEQSRYGSVSNARYWKGVASELLAKIRDGDTVDELIKQDMREAYSLDGINDSNFVESHRYNAQQY